LFALVAARHGEWQEDRHSGGRGRPVHKFCLLPASTSTEILNSRGETGNCVDVDEPKTSQNEASGEPENITRKAVPISLVGQAAQESR
jgi:hypothetical protein